MTENWAGPESEIYIFACIWASLPYTRKLSREKTFTHEFRSIHENGSTSEVLAHVFSRENFLLYSIALYIYPIGYLYIATFLVGELVFRYLVARKMVAWIPYPFPAKLGFFVSIFGNGCLLLLWYISQNSFPYCVVA